MTPSGSILEAATTTVPPVTAALRKSPRIVFVDILRLLAAVQMINGHTLDAVMVDSLREGAFYSGYMWARGLVSMAFLMASGMAFHLSTLVPIDRFLTNGDARRLRVKRLLWIILIGYFLIPPFGFLSPDPAAHDTARYYFYRIGILHCIGAALLCLHGLTLALRDPRRVAFASGVLATAIFALAPWADGLISDGQPRFLLNWISHGGGSQFPLLPWTGVVFTGVVFGAIALPEGGRTKLSVIAGRLILLTVIAAVLREVVESAPVTFFDAARHHPSTSPLLSIEKIRNVGVLLIVVSILTYPIKHLPTLFQILATETLTIYAFHIVVLFFPVVGLTNFVDHNLSLKASLSVAATMLIVTCSATYGWNRYKTGTWKLASRGRRGS